ncbi:glycosyl hydrolase family 65 protein [Paraflavisolibacter sp. H34]|uniref:MGH1-like glycoside hydrolase domain-containing protein n=1 Tax=Huijunlia imazamoxiresistens TaxID=3127457 RepID=UPI00301A8153
MKSFFKISLSLLLLQAGFKSADAQVLNADKLKTHVGYFNSVDSEYAVNLIANKDAADWMQQNVPLFECPDQVIEQTYYYRWWTLRKHLKQTPDGYVFTEFITPVNHAGKYNTVSSALGHHINEARWLRDPQYLNQYINFWVFVDAKTPKPHLRAFSSWLQDAVYQQYLVKRDKAFVQLLLPALDADYRAWEGEKMLPSKMFWQYDVRDAMEESISGGRRVKNVRPTINSYMYGNAKALVALAKLAGVDSLQKIYGAKAAQLRAQTQSTLWDDTASFFKVQFENGKLCDAREVLGYIPWYFNLPEDKSKYARQWDQLLDTAGFDAPWGITTAERRHPGFRTHGTGHGCEWDGAVWPFATSQTLKGLSNLLTSYKHKGKMTPAVFYDELRTYAWSHQKNGKPYLGEYQDEKTGYWLKGDNPRSSYYNHSTFCDLVISDLVGLKPRPDNVLELHPLVPEGKWDWFALDNVNYNGRTIGILWDKDGSKYGKGKGLRLYVDGKEVYQGKKLKPVKVKLKA